MAKLKLSAAMIAAALLIAQPAKADKAAAVGVIEKACIRSDALYADGKSIGTLSAKALWKAIAKGFPVPIGEDLSDGQTLSARRLAEKITLIKPSAEDAPPFVSVRNIMRLWMGIAPGMEPAGFRDRLGTDGVVIAARDGHALQFRDLPDLLADVISSEDGNFIFYCAPPTDSPTPPADKTNPLVIAKTPADLISPLKEKSFGEFSFIDDRQKRAQSYGIDAAVGWKIDLPPIDRSSGEGETRRSTRLTRSLVPYVQIVRKGTNDPKDAAKPQEEKSYLNSLTFGGQFGGRFESRGRNTYIHYFAASAAYQTDDDFDSEVHLFEARVDPDFPWNLPGHRTFYNFLAPTDDQEALNASIFEARWTTALVFDLVDVEDPGNFKKLAEKKEFSRLGYDLKLDFLFGLSDQAWRLKWANEYKLRDGQTRDGGDAQLFSSKLLIMPRDDSRFSFGLGYTRGEDLGTLEQSEIWNLVVGIRR